MTLNQSRLLNSGLAAQKIALLAFLIFDLSFSALAADQQPRAVILQPDQVHRGDQIRIYDKSGRVFELVVEAVATPDQLEPDSSLTGTYISDITDNENRYFRNANHRRLVVSLEQDNEKITGKVQSLAGGYIEGTRQGDTVKFTFYGVPAIASYEIRGEWTVNADGDLLEGSWKHSVAFASGKWNMMRLDPVVATRHAASPVIRGRLVEDESSFEMRLADIARIEESKSDLTPESIIDPASVAQSSGASDQQCNISEQAVKAIENAWSVWNQAEYTPGMYDLIKQAEAAAKSPECDNDNAIGLAGQAVRLAEGYERVLPPPGLATSTSGPKEDNARTLPSQPHGEGFAEINLSRVAFDDGNLGGSVFLWGLTFGGTVFSQYEIAYSYNSIVPLISPDLDKPAELDTGEYLDVEMQMLSLRRNWKINDTTTVFALVGYSKTYIKIDHLSVCIYCGFSINSQNTYRSKRSGSAWGLGMQWKTSNKGYRSLKYVDHSQSGFDFSGVHLDFGTYF